MRFSDDFVIESERLIIFAVNIAEYEKLAIDRANPTLWVDRGFINTYGHLVDKPGPLRHRIPRIAKDPSLVPSLLRMAVL